MGKGRRKRHRHRWHPPQLGERRGRERKELPLEDAMRLRLCEEAFDDLRWDIGEGMSLVMGRATNMSSSDNEFEDRPTLAIKLRARQPALTENRE